MPLLPKFIRILTLGGALTACAAVHASTVPAQIYLGVPQPIAGTQFQVTVLVEKAGDAAAAATGTVTVNFEDGTSPATVSLTNSVALFTHTYPIAGQFSISASYAGDSTTSGTAASQSGTVLSAAPAAVLLKTFGDSITQGQGATEDFSTYVSQAEGWSVNDLGDPGANSADVCNIIYANSVAGGQNSAAPSYSTLLDGENDLTEVNTYPAALAQYTSSMLACSAWLAIPSSTPSGAAPKRTAQDSANTPTGTWTASDLYTSIGRKSTVAGSTLRGSFTGNVLYAGLTATASSNDAIAIAVDGVTMGTYSPQLTYPGKTISYGPLGYRIPVGGSAGAEHTVTFSCVSPGSSGCYVDWYGGNGYGGAGIGPYLWLATPMYDLQSVYPDTPFLAMTNAVRGIQQELASDGLSVYRADTYSTLVGQTQPQCYYDDRHPNACGQQIMAATFEQSMNALLQYASYMKLTSAGLHNFGYVADGLSTTYGVQVTNETGAAYPVNISLTGSAAFSKYSNCPTSLAAGAKCEIIFIFAPEAGETGWVSANWSLGGPSPVLPQNGGTLEGDAYASTTPVLNTSAHDFGTVAVGSRSGAFGLVIVNPNSTPFTGTLSWTGSTNQFSVTGGCALPLPAFSNCVANVTFAPAAAGSQAMQLTLTPAAGEKTTPGNVVTFSGAGK